MKTNTHVDIGWLPKGWQEISRIENDQQVTIRIGHINPEDKAEPMLTSGNPSQTVGGEPVAVHGITTRGTMTKFYESMKVMAATGWMKGYTPEKIEKMRGDANKLQHEKYDMTTDITAIRYQDAKAAKQALQNQITMQTKGIMNITVPGTDKSMLDVLDIPQVKKGLNAEQLAMLTKMKRTMNGEMEQKIKEVHKKEGLSYHMGTYLGYAAAFSEIENPEYARFMAPKPKVKQDPHAFHGGGFDPLAGKGILPKRPKPQAPPKVIQSCLGIQVGAYVVSGMLLGTVPMLPPGSTFCEGLTKHKIYIEKENVEGKMYTTKHVVPVASTYAKEGYVYREEAEQMIKDFIGALKK